MADFERPTLPEGYFYRVDVYIIPTVEVRRKRRFGSEHIASSVIQGDNTPQNLTSAACRAFEYATRTIQWRETMQTLRPYEGDYR